MHYLRLRTRAVLSGSKVLAYDVRFALRSLARDGIFSSTAIVTLALALGLNVTAFSVMDTMLFRGRRATLFVSIFGVLLISTLALRAQDTGASAPGVSVFAGKFARQRSPTTASLPGGVLISARLASRIELLQVRQHSRGMMLIDYGVISGHPAGFPSKLTRHPTFDRR